jgi:glycine oxidase
VECIVIGAGIVGCAVAHELSMRGARVRLLDARDVGQGATRASAGVLCPHIEGHAPDLLTLGVRSLHLYDRFVETVRADSTLPVEYRRTGTLEVALNDDDAAKLRAQAERHRKTGVEHRYFEAREARELERALSEQVTGALLVPEHGYVGVAGLTQALAAAAESRGATIDSAVMVRDIAQRPSHIDVTADGRTFSGDVVVIAAGSWSGTIRVGAARAPVKPVRGQLLCLAFPSAPVSRVIWGANCYLVPWEDGTLLVGATVEDVGFDEHATVAGVHDLLDAACELLPSAWTARFEAVRVGLRPATSDELPIVGRSSEMPGVIYATGHYRNGVLLAPLTAHAVGELVMTEEAPEELLFTRPERFGL